MLISAILLLYNWSDCIWKSLPCNFMFFITSL
nr:MAG TPA: hypothetical protein [Caudoviricetes sp.]